MAMASQATADTVTRGDQAGEMGDSLPYTDLGSGGAKSIAGGTGGHTCAILMNGSVNCWGVNGGVLGTGDGPNRGDGPGEMGAAMPTVPLGTARTAKELTTGVGFTCALLDNNLIKCWGLNDRGQLGLGDTLFRGDDTRRMGNALPYMSLGTSRTAKSLSAGYASACAILNTNELKCWGYNGFGQLGLGDSAVRGDAAGEMGQLAGREPGQRSHHENGVGRQHARLCHPRQ